jgi:2-oxoglutarate ferredoxin oxidoreductase subunit delta
MRSVDIRTERCKGCGLCVEACPKHVIEMSKDINESGYFYAEVEHPEACTSCRLCAQICPEVGITLGDNSKKKDE